LGAVRYLLDADSAESSGFSPETVGHSTTARYDAAAATARYEEARVEPLSILNPPITDILSDPRVTSAALLKMIDEQEGTITQQLRDLSTKVKREDTTPFDVMIFACIQHHLHVTTLNTKLTARSMDLAYGNLQLSHALERLTKCLIGLTIALGVLALPLAVDVILKWLK
jgi:hypothetical protein